MNIRIDDDLKARSGVELNALGVTTSEAVRLVLEYVAQNNRLPVQVALLANEDADIVELARARLANLGKWIRVKLDDLSEDAFEEWHRLDTSVRAQFKKKLAKLDRRSAPTR